MEALWYQPKNKYLSVKNRESIFAIICAPRELLLFVTQRSSIIFFMHLSN